MVFVVFVVFAVFVYWSCGKSEVNTIIGSVIDCCLMAASGNPLPIQVVDFVGFSCLLWNSRTMFGEYQQDNNVPCGSETMGNLLATLASAKLFPDIQLRKARHRTK